MVLDQVAGGREVFTGEISTHAREHAFNILLRDFPSGSNTSSHTHNYKQYNHRDIFLISVV